jgi:hypothetical protein
MSTAWDRSASMVRLSPPTTPPSPMAIAMACSAELATAFTFTVIVPV